jgi:hypothetical protein
MGSSTKGGGPGRRVKPVARIPGRAGGDRSPSADEGGGIRHVVIEPAHGPDVGARASDDRRRTGSTCRGRP